jgi:hypothetical protein
MSSCFANAFSAFRRSIAYQKKIERSRNESADPEQCYRDKRIDLQNVVRQLGRDRTGEVQDALLAAYSVYTLG